MNQKVASKLANSIRQAKEKQVVDKEAVAEKPTTTETVTKTKATKQQQVSYPAVSSRVWPD